MARPKKPIWYKIQHAYVTGNLGYRQLAEKFGVPFRTLQEEAKKNEWVKKRKEYRDEVAAKAASRACAREVDKLAALTEAADSLTEKMDLIAKDGEQLFMHTAVVGDVDGGSDLIERRLEAFNPMALTALAKAMKDMTQVLRNLHSIQTRGEEEAAKLARDRLELERQKFAFEKEKAGAEGTDRTIVVEMDAESGEEAQ